MMAIPSFVRCSGSLLAGICLFASCCWAYPAFEEFSYTLDGSDASNNRGPPMAKRHMLIPFPRMGKSVGTPFRPNHPRSAYFLQNPYYMEQNYLTQGEGDDEMSYADEDLADLIQGLEGGHKRSPYAPRLGKKRASPIAPRLGRPDPRSLYSPRIGKDLESSEKSFEQQQSANTKQHVPGNDSGSGNDIEPRDLFIPRLG